MPVERSKLGQFAIVVGLILTAVFFAAGEGRGMAVGYLLSGLVLVFLGGYLYLRGRKPDDPNTARFRTVRKFRERKDKRKEEQAQRRKSG